MLGCSCVKYFMKGKHMPRGGRRKGAGRPKSPIKTIGIKITLPLKYHSMLRYLGGSKWVKAMIDRHYEDAI